MKDIYNIKNDFPIFRNNEGLVYLDSAATTQKPSYVIDSIKNLYENDYANIHRGMYSLSERSEELYFQSKSKIAKSIGGKSSEIIYSYNATYLFNIISSSLLSSGYIKKGDKILLTEAEHHANLVPWLILKDDYGVDIDFIKIDKNYEIDFEDFYNKYDENVKLVASSYVSNVTGSIFDLEKLGNLLRDDTLFVVDGSQAIPNFKVNVYKINCDFFVFTGHKIMAETGIGVLWGKKELLKNISPSIGGGGAISCVGKKGFEFGGIPDKFEPGTPNISGAVSLLRAFDYIQEIGGWDKVREKEEDLVKYAIEKFKEIEDKVDIIGKTTSKNRVGVFSFVLKDGTPAMHIGEKLAMENICIRCGGHCAHPLLESFDQKSVCRMSLYFYNDKEDIDVFIEKLKNII